MPNTEGSRVVLVLGQSPAEEAVGQTGLACPLSSQNHNLPPEHTLQLITPLLITPLLTALLEHQLSLLFLSLHPPDTDEVAAGGQCSHSEVCPYGSPVC